MLAIMLTGLVLRLAALWPLSMHHPDELIQYAEQAHRLEFGYGAVPWEYRVGMRSWLVPIVLTAPMKLGDWIAPGTMLHLMLPRLIAVVASLSVIWSAWRIGARLSALHGLVAAAVIAIWFEQVMFSSHLLTEMLAVSAFMPAATILLDRSASWRALIVAGFLLGLACIMRFHYGPAIGLFVLATCYDRIKSVTLPLIIGGLIMAMLSMAADLAMGQYPFQWIAENFRQNIQLGAAAKFGVTGPFAYIGMMAGYWQIALVPILLLMIPAIRSQWPLFLAAIVNLVIHSAIGHKEYRFILLTTTIFILLSAIGSVELLRMFRARNRDGLFTGKRGVAILAVLWLALSGYGATTMALLGQWNNLTQQFALGRAIGEDRSICGVALYRMVYWELGGSVTMRRDIPVYYFPAKQPDTTAAGLSTHSAHFSAIATAPENQSDLPKGYVKRSCTTAGPLAGVGQSREICLYVRPGSCAIDASNPKALNTALRQLGH